jgi:hypothetical protein
MAAVKPARDVMRPAGISAALRHAFLFLAMSRHVMGHARFFHFGRLDFGADFIERKASRLVVERAAVRRHGYPQPFEFGNEITILHSEFLC